MLHELLQERFDVIHPVLAGKIKSIESIETLKGLFRLAVKVESLQEYKRIVDRVLHSRSDAGEISQLNPAGQGEAVFCDGEDE